jgi:hypothetical protein
MRASPAVLSMLPYTEKFDEEKSKCASLVTELDLAKHTCTVWGDLAKGAATLCTCTKDCNKYDVTCAQCF